MMTETIITCALEIAATLAILAIGIVGARLAARIAKKRELAAIAAATKEVIQAAQITVSELNQTVVAALKKDGTKLTSELIAVLKDDLLTMAYSKISTSAITLLEIAAVDVRALIIGVGEDWISKIKTV